MNHFILCIIYLLVMGGGVASMALLRLRGRKAGYNWAYFVCQGLAMLWCASQILAMLSQNERELWVANLVANVGICFIGTFWFYFAALYTRGRLGKPFAILPALLSGFHYGMVLSNQWHHLYYKSFGRGRLEHGIFYYSNVAVTYILVLSGAFMLFRYLQTSGREERSVKSDRYLENRTAQWLVIGAVCVPVAINIIYQTGILHTEFDVTPLGFGISVILILLATIRYRFLEGNLKAFEAVLGGLSDSVLIFDSRGECIFYNAAARESFFRKCGKEHFSFSGERDELFCGTIKFTLDRAIQLLKGFEREEDQEVVLRLGEEGYFQPQWYQSVSQNKRDHLLLCRMEELQPDRETVLVLRDVSAYYRSLRQMQELSVANERLALERERNRIAGQVHDTAGHTLTMIGSYLKLAMVANRNREQLQVEEYIKDARELSGEGLRELRQSINRLRREASCELVTQGIMQLADRVREIPVEVTIQGEDSEKYSHLTEPLYECTRESITNTLKYAEADRMDIILRFLEDGVELVIGDDGRGCEQINENNGVRGIRERVEKAGGTVRFITAGGEGFLTRVKLPL